MLLEVFSTLVGHSFRAVFTIVIHLNEVGAKVGVDLLTREKARERVVVEDGARHLAVDDALDGKANAAEVRASHLVLGNVQRRISLRVVGRFLKCWNAWVIG